MTSAARPGASRPAVSASAGPLRRVPVWVWRALMAMTHRLELARFNSEPVAGVRHIRDIDFAGDGARQHRLDVIVPDPASGSAGEEPLPVYIYFHGGGWTSGDKAALTKYCAIQAAAGMVVVNANYRMATRFRMAHMVEDANAVLAWVAEHIAEHGGDPSRLVLGGDSAGGQLSALIAAAVFDAELAGHYGIEPAVPPGSVRGLVQHCSAVDLSVVFERGFVLSRSFVRMLLPKRVPEQEPLPLAVAARHLSPIEWLDSGFPPVLVTTSERDYFYRANLNFVAALRRRGIPVETLIYDRARANAMHTWQQNYRYPESQEVYRRLQGFVRSVAGTRRPVHHAPGV